MMKYVDNVDCCIGCGACEQICPKKCIKMVYDDKGFLVPNVDKGKCINCGKCSEVCVQLNKIQVKKSSIIKIYGAAYKDEEIVMKSSSGGAFYAFAEMILNKGGIVAGVIIDENYHVKHVVIDSIDDIYPLLCSKYVQSDMDNTFSIIASAVSENRVTLFVGTPCQCAALKRYLSKKGLADALVSKYLIAVEFICHGVPSPQIWEQYIQSLCEEKGIRLTNVGFRRKTDAGWHQFFFTYREGILIKNIPIRDDLFYNGFLENLFLRESCHECYFKGVESAADISIADFWGSEIYAPKLNGHMQSGLSLITIFSETGNRLFDEVKVNLDFIEVDDIRAYTSNTASVDKARRNRHTKAFYRLRNSKGTVYALKKYARYTILKKIINKTKWMILDIKRNTEKGIK